MFKLQAHLWNAQKWESLLAIVIEKPINWPVPLNSIHKSDNNLWVNGPIRWLKRRNYLKYLVMILFLVTQYWIEHLWYFLDLFFKRKPYINLCTKNTLEKYLKYLFLWYIYTWEITKDLFSLIPVRKWITAQYAIT